MTDSDVADAVDPDVPAPPAAEEYLEPRPRRRYWPLVVGLVALALVTFALSALGTRYTDLSSERTDREKVEAVSGQFAAALLTYDYKRMDAGKARVLSFATGKFKREYEQVFAGFKVLIEQTQARSTSTVTDVFVGPVEGGTASSIAVIDAVARGSSGRRNVTSYLQLDLVKAGGEWKVNSVTNLNFGQPTEGPASPATPPTSSAR